MSDDTEYRHVLHKISGVSNLTRERKNHKYVEEFLNQWNIIFAYGTYLFEGEIAAQVDPSFSASETWSLMQDPHVTLSNSDKNFRRQMVNFMCALKHIQCIEGQLTSGDIKTLMEKSTRTADMCSSESLEKRPYLQVFTSLLQLLQFPN